MIFFRFLQGRETDIISSVEKITAFKWKLDLWLKRIPKGSFAQFLKIQQASRKHASKLTCILSDIEVHLILRRSKFDYIIPTKKVALSWVQNSFLVNINNVEKNSQKKFLI